MVRIDQAWQGYGMARRDYAVCLRQASTAGADLADDAILYIKEGAVEYRVLCIHRDQSVDVSDEQRAWRANASHLRCDPLSAQDSFEAGAIGRDIERLTDRLTSGLDIFQAIACD